MGHCGITVKKGISSGKYRWKILYDPIDVDGWLLIAVQYNKPICSSTTSYGEKEIFGMNIYRESSDSFGSHRIEGKSITPKELNLKANSGEVLEVIVDCELGVFQLISSTFDHSISLPKLKSNENYYLHFDPYDTSFSLLSVEKIL